MIENLFEYFVIGGALYASALIVFGAYHQTKLWYHQRIVRQLERVSENVVQK